MPFAQLAAGAEQSSKVVSEQKNYLTALSGDKFKVFAQFRSVPANWLSICRFLHRRTFSTRFVTRIARFDATALAHLRSCILQETYRFFHDHSVVVWDGTRVSGSNDMKAFWKLIPSTQHDVPERNLASP